MGVDRVELGGLEKVLKSNSRRQLNWTGVTYDSKEKSEARDFIFTETQHL